jgi:hypothetical protein
VNLPLSDSDGLNRNFREDHQSWVIGTTLATYHPLISRLVTAPLLNAWKEAFLCLEALNSRLGPLFHSADVHYTLFLDREAS